jgi:hypothetical protein
VALLLALVSALLFLAAGCSSVQRVVLSEDGPGHASVALLSGTPVPEAAPDPALAAMSPFQAEVSLRRLVVRPSTWLSIVRGEPQPFLSPEQVRWAAGALSRHLPGLRPDQRLELRFQDRFKGYEVQVQVYREGVWLVYRFLKLAADPTAPPDPTRTLPLNYVALEPQPGQALESDPFAFVLKDPLRKALLAVAEHESEKLALIRDAFRAGTLDVREARELELLARQRPELSLAVWRLFLDKRATLEKARTQGLLDEPAYNVQRRALRSDLEP